MHIRFQFLPQVTHPQRMLERSEAALLAILRGLLSPDHPEEALFEEAFLCLICKETSWRRVSSTPSAIGSQPHRHAAIGRRRQFLRCLIPEAVGVSRRVEVNTYGVPVVHALRIGVELVATVHAQLARVFAQTWHIATRTMPIPIEAMRQSKPWHKYRTHDPGLACRGMPLRSQWRAWVK